MPLIDFDVKCSRCGAGLQGVALDGSCPHCGLGVSGTLHLPAIDSATMTVCVDAPCRQCEYNLRTLAVGAICPECGSPVAPSLVPVALVFADASWLRDQRGMATMLLVCMLLPLVGGMIVWAMRGLGELDVAFIIVIMLSFFEIPALFGGTWALCEHERYRPHPRYIRLLPTAYAVSLLVAPFLFVVAVCSALSPVSIVTLGVLLCCLVGPFLCDALSIRYMGERAGSRGLRTLATAWAGCLVGLIVFIIAESVILVCDEFLRSADGFLRTAGIIVATLAGAAYVLGVLTVGACRFVLTDVLRRQEGNAPTVSRDNAERHQGEGEAACR